MATKLLILAAPSQLRYDHEEVLPGGAQFCRFETLDALKAYWTREHASMRYACVGTGFMAPARFLETNEWVFAPTKESLVAAVVRWDEFKVAPRWYDPMSDELSVKHQLQRRRVANRDLSIALGDWSDGDEAAYGFNTLQGRGYGRRGFWRLDSLPCGLTHFDWFSEHAAFPNDPELPKETVAVWLQRATFDDWKNHQCFHEVLMLDSSGVDEEIVYWEREHAEGREAYED